MQLIFSWYARHHWNSQKYCITKFGVYGTLQENKTATPISVNCIKIKHPDFQFNYIHLDDSVCSSLHLSHFKLLQSVFDLNFWPVGHLLYLAVWILLTSSTLKLFNYISDCVILYSTDDCIHMLGMPLSQVKV